MKSDLIFKSATHTGEDDSGRLQPVCEKKKGVLVTRRESHMVSLLGLCLGIENKIKLEWSLITSSVPQTSWVVTGNGAVPLGFQSISFPQGS